MRLWRHRRGSVALMTAIMAPVMVMMMSMGIEVTYWSVNQVELQRIADIAAWSAARNYISSSNAQTAGGIGADIAEINGISGTASRIWNAATGTLTDNLITVAMVAGVKTTSDTAFAVTVKRSIIPTFSAIFPSTPAAISISATATAEISGGGETGPQPCLVALATPTTSNDITVSGSASVTASGCSVRSNGGITLSGSAKITADGTYAGGSISVPAGSTNAITGGSYANDGTLPDPYAAYAPLQNAFAELSSGGTAVNLANGGTQTISPGTFSSIAVNGGASLTMRAGLYIVNGGFQLANGGTITGSGVTIVASGSISLGGGGTMNVTAPLSGAASGVPGIIFASKSTAASSIANGATPPYGGVIYYPNGSMTLAGSVPGGSGCNEFIAATFTISGSSNFSSNCTGFGTETFGSVPVTPSIALVQ